MAEVIFIVNFDRFEFFLKKFIHLFFFNQNS